MQEHLDRLKYLVQVMPSKLYLISPEDFSFKSSNTKWSKKEILGHLLDSATNNHHRFVRAQIEDNPSISYDQEMWNKVNRYQELDINHIINFWVAYNNHLLFILESMSSEAAEKVCWVGADSFTLKEFAIDYVRHLEHHLKQIVDY